MSVTNQQFTDSLNYISDLTARTVCYLPYGFLLPLANLIDAARFYLKLKNLPEHYQAIEAVPRGQRPFKNSLNEKHLAALGLLDSLFQKAWFIPVWVFVKMVPSNLQRHSSAEKQWFLQAKHWLHKHPGSFVYKGVLPGCIIGGILAIGGPMLFVECYLFYACSFWSGLLINTLTNVLVLRQQSEEWQNLLIFKNFIQKTDGDDRLPTIIQSLKDLSMRVVVDFAFFGFLNRHKELFYGCFSYFFVWTGIYLSTKASVNCSPELLLSYEKRMQKPDYQPGPNQLVWHNLTWISGYHVLHSLGSNVAIQEYQHSHQAVFASSEVEGLLNSSSAPMNVDALERGKFLANSSSQGGSSPNFTPSESPDLSPPPSDDEVERFPLSHKQSPSRLKATLV